MAFVKALLLPLILLSCRVLAASLQQVSNFGTNPTNTQMFVYKPDKVAANPPLLVAIHYCQGTAQAFFSGTQYSTLANTYGFIVIYPNAPDPGGCWDVHSDATFKHDAGGDSLGIASMVRYAIANYGVDANRVFVTGLSSGAMMTNVLLGAYPDLFKGGSAWAGVPYGCFAGPGLWNNACANGQVSKTAAQWGDLVRSGYPGFTGTRPKMQVWHGTADTTLNYNNFGEEIKQWTNVLGYPQTGTAQANTPQSGYTKTVYGSNFEAYSASGVTHNIPIRAQDVITWFGLDKSAPPTTTGPATTTTPTTVPTTAPTSAPTTTPTTAPTTAPTTVPTPPTSTVPHYGQCGGQSWTGGTVCEAPYTCKASNQWYSQCL